MMRALAVLLLLGAVVVGAVWLADHPGMLRLDMLGYRIEMSLMVAMALVAFCVLALLAFSALVFRLADIPSQLSARRNYRTQQQGIESLTHTLTRLAAGQWKQADEQLAATARHLGQAHPAVLLLGAQLARAQGNREKMKQQFNAMLATEQTAWLAHKGLAEQAAHEGNSAEAYHHAAEVLKNAPADRTMHLIALDREAREHRWEAMRTQIVQASRHHALPTDEARRYTAICLLMQAREIEEPKQKRKLMKAAYTAQPQWLVAQLDYLEMLRQQSCHRRWRNTLSSAWATGPAPLLADEWLSGTAILPARKRIKQSLALIAPHPDHVESHLLMARLYLELGQPEEARRHARAALEQASDTRIFRVFIAIEKATNGSADAIRQWEMQAASAPDGTARWHCAKCGHAQSHWDLFCHTCDSFDSFTLQSQGHARTTLSPTLSGGAHA